jgi:hypothetical protein
MKILSESEGVQWLEEHGVCDLRDQACIATYLYHATLPIAKDSGRKTAIARQLVYTLLSNNTESAVWISGHGIWPSSENMALFDALRSSMRESRSLDEAPFHVVDQRDSKEAECLIGLTLYFVWDGWLIDIDRELLLEISHDEVFVLHGKQEQHFLGLKELLGKMCTPTS